MDANRKSKGVNAKTVTLIGLLGAVLLAGVVWMIVDWRQKAADAAADAQTVAKVERLLEKELAQDAELTGKYGRFIQLRGSGYERPDYPWKLVERVEFDRNAEFERGSIPVHVVVPGVPDASLDEEALEIWQWRIEPPGKLSIWVGPATNPWADEPSYYENPTAVALSPDEATVATGYRNVVRLWDAESGKSLAEYTGHFGKVHELKFSPDGQTIAASCGDGSVRLWKTATRELAKTFHGHPTSDYFPLEFSPDGRLLAAGGPGDEIRLWNLDRNELQATLGAAQAGNFAALGVFSLAFTPDGRRIIAARADRTFVVQTVPTESESATPSTTLDGGFCEPYCLSVSPDGKTFAIGGSDIDDRAHAKVWDLGQPQPKWTLRHEMPFDPRRPSPKERYIRQSFVISVAFSPDGTRIASASWPESKVIIWDATTGRQIRSLNGDPDWESPVAFSPQGKTWDSVSQEAWMTFDIPMAPENSVRDSGCKRARGRGLLKVVFLRDGRLAAFSSHDGAAWMWKEAKLAEDNPLTTSPSKQTRLLSEAKLAEDNPLTTEPGQNDHESKPRPTALKVKRGFAGVVREREVDGAIGQPISNVEIVFLSEDGSVKGVTRSNRFGQYTIELPSGRYRVSASHADFATLAPQKGFVVSDGQSLRRFNIFLTRNQEEP